MGRADALAPGLGMPVAALMENAGRAVARAIRARYPAAAGCWCWPARATTAATATSRRACWHRRVGRCVGRAGAAAGGSDAAGRGAWRGPTAPFAAPRRRGRTWWSTRCSAPGWPGPWTGWRPSLRAARRIVAVDVPSGSTAPRDGARVTRRSAELTVTFFRLKPGHLLLPGRDLCGGSNWPISAFPDGVLDGSRRAAFANLPTLWQLPALAASSPQIHARACHRCRRRHDDRRRAAGRRSGSASRRRHGHDRGTRWRGGYYRAGEPGCWSAKPTSPSCCTMTGARSGFAAPGWARTRRGPSFPALIAANRTVVGDADVFSAFAGEPDALRGAAVLTPHAGEFARVFGAPARDRLSAARAAAARTGAVVLLKGADTIIAAPDGRAAINLPRRPGWRPPGAGDVLAGIIAGLLAQGMPAWEAAGGGCLSAWPGGGAGRTRPGGRRPAAGTDPCPCRCDRSAMPHSMSPARL